MLRSGVPGIERHAAWLLAQQAQAGARPPLRPRRWLTAQGETRAPVPVPASFPLDPADDPQLVRIALARPGTGELAEAATAGARAASPRSSPAVPAVLASAVHARGLLTGKHRPAGPGRRHPGCRPAKGSRWPPPLEDLAAAEIRAGRSEQAIAALDRALVQLRRLAEPAGIWGRVRRRLQAGSGIRRRPAPPSAGPAPRLGGPDRVRNSPWVRLGRRRPHQPRRPPSGSTFPLTPFNGPPPPRLRKTRHQLPRRPLNPHRRPSTPNRPRGRSTCGRAGHMRAPFPVTAGQVAAVDPGGDDRAVLRRMPLPRPGWPGLRVCRAGCWAAGHEGTRRWRPEPSDPAPPVMICTGGEDLGKEARPAAGAASG